MYVGFDWSLLPCFGQELRRESDGGAVHRTNPDSLKSCFCLRILRLSFHSDFLDLLLVKFHQAEIIS